MKSIMPYNRAFCIECGGRGTQDHHCIFGKNRKNSDKYGLIVRLCGKCHRRLHDEDEELAMKYRKLGQICFEEYHSHAEFMKIFGRNYL